MYHPHLLRNDGTRTKHFEICHDRSREASTPSSKLRREIALNIEKVKTMRIMRLTPSCPWRAWMQTTRSIQDRLSGAGLAGGQQPVLFESVVMPRTKRCMSIGSLSKNVL